MPNFLKKYIYKEIRLMHFQLKKIKKDCKKTLKSHYQITIQCDYL